MICPTCRGNKGFCGCEPSDKNRLCRKCGELYNCNGKKNNCSSLNEYTCSCPACYTPDSTCFYGVVQP
jgi:hypothetical protein